MAAGHSDGDLILHMTRSSHDPPSGIGDAKQLNANAFVTKGPHNEETKPCFNDLPSMG